LITCLYGLKQVLKKLHISVIRHDIITVGLSVYQAFGRYEEQRIIANTFLKRQYVAEVLLPKPGSGVRVD